MNCNTQNAKIASITEKTLIIGIDVGSETHYARAFDWRNYEYSRKGIFPVILVRIVVIQFFRFLDMVGIHMHRSHSVVLQEFPQWTRIKNRIARWFAIYFPEYKDVYGDLKAASGRMVLKVAPLPDDIIKLGAEGVNQIWRDAKLRGVGSGRSP